MWQPFPLIVFSFGRLISPTARGKLHQTRPQGVGVSGVVPADTQLFIWYWSCDCRWMLHGTNSGYEMKPGAQAWQLRGWEGGPHVRIFDRYCTLQKQGAATREPGQWNVSFQCPHAMQIFCCLGESSRRPRCSKCPATVRRAGSALVKLLLTLTTRPPFGHLVRLRYPQAVKFHAKPREFIRRAQKDPSFHRLACK